MSPVVQAAIIAAASTGAIAIVGFLVNGWTTSRTLEAARDQLHDQRLWDRRAELYAEIFAFVGHRSQVRANKLRTIRYTPEGEAAVQAHLDSYQQPLSFTFDARVLAFGSEAVFDALAASRDANDRVWSALRARDEAREAASADPGSTDPHVLARLTEELKHLADEATEADDVVYHAIRDELHPRAPRTLRWRHVPGWLPGVPRKPAATGPPQPAASPEIGKPDTA